MRIKTFPEYQEAYKKSVEQPEQFWKEVADTFLWRKKWDKIPEWIGTSTAPFAIMPRQ